ncbi:hypothetical protein LI063_13545 [Clostridium perfringens]|uniref:hypothetical protein n=1 Tax=Clostridium perfringens TaxID=1502 RepID=UPI0022481BB7|nr:hypothetical protein [Clostridium perfringens]MCX0365171.1 hypothetical protein [Clostridium perfringens]
MKEIGGYFELENLISDEYYSNLISLNSARNSLLYLIKVKNITKLHIPYYLCDSVINVLKNNKINFDYYKVNSDFTPKFEGKLKKNEFLYIVNYFGQVSNEMILNFKELFKNIIIDNTHAFFQNPIDGIDTIYSCRKFFGVPDGAYLSTDIKDVKKLPLDKSKDRMQHLLGRYEENAFDYYKQFQTNDEIFEKEPIKQMSRITHNILGAIDYEYVRRVRNKNYIYLYQKLKKFNKLNLNIPDGAFCYPLYIENSFEIRKKLIDNRIYISKLWPNVLNEDRDKIALKYSNNILPIPCDQRYNEKDMEYIVDIILEELIKEMGE